MQRRGGVQERTVPARVCSRSKRDVFRYKPLHGAKGSRQESPKTHEDKKEKGKGERESRPKRQEKRRHDPHRTARTTSLSPREKKRRPTLGYKRRKTISRGAAAEAEGSGAAEECARCNNPKRTSIQPATSGSVFAFDKQKGQKSQGYRKSGAPLPHFRALDTITQEI